jgi:WD40 repeat protein
MNSTALITLAAGLLLQTEEPREPTATLTGHTGRVTSVAVSPDGQTLASGSSDQTVKLWDVATGKERATLRGHTKEVYALAFAPDGRTLASGGADGAVKLWDWAQAREQRSFRGHDGVVWSVAFAADGRTLATGGQDGAVKLWDCEALKERATLKGHTKSVWGLAFTPDGQRLASASPEEVVRLWDVATGTQRAALHRDGNRVTSLGPAPDGRMLATGGGDGTVTLWEVATGQQRATLKIHAGTVYALAFAAGGVMASGWDDGTVKLWDTAASRELTTVRGHRRSVTSLAFVSGGQALASGSADETVLLWDMPVLDRGKPAQSISTETLWNELATEDAKKSFRAVCDLTLCPSQAATLLGERLRPAAPTPAALAQWLTDLDDEDYAVRRKAAESIAQLGDLAEPALRQALRGRPTLEVRRRVESLLDRIVAGTLPPEQLRELRAVEVLELIGTPEAKKVLARLAAGASEARLTREAKSSLQRLERRAGR